MSPQRDLSPSLLTSGERKRLACRVRRPRRIHFENVLRASAMLFRMCPAGRRPATAREDACAPPGHLGRFAPLFCHRVRDNAIHPPAAALLVRGVVYVPPRFHWQRLDD